MSSAFDPANCVPLRKTYEVFEQLKKTPLTLHGSSRGMEHAYSIVDNPDKYAGFLPTCETWVDGAATFVGGEWLIFIGNDLEYGWKYLKTCIPIGMHDSSVILWRKDIIDTLDTFFGYRFRNRE